MLHAFRVAPPSGSPSPLVIRRFMMSLASRKLPAALVSGVVCLFLGAAIAVVVMASLVRTDPQVAANPIMGDNSGKDAGPAGGGSKMGPKGVKGGGGGGGKGGGGGGGKGGGGPGPKVQLARLVNKLDVLTIRPLTVQLTPQQKQDIKKLLADLDANEELTDDEAKTKLDALMKLVEGQKDTLEAAGYIWPAGQGGGGGGGGMGGGGVTPPPPNPFKTEPNAAHLKSLQATLGK
jgi:hypothetical protein